MAEAVLLAAVAGATGVICCGATRALIPILRRRAILDRPNERSSHIVPVPRGGGIALLGAVLLGWIALILAGMVRPIAVAVLGAAGLLAVVSWIDDLRGLSPLPRLMAQAASVAIGLFALTQPQDASWGWLAPAGYCTALGLLWVWWINLFNFMDGIDGIAGSEAAAIAVGLTLLAELGGMNGSGLAAPAAAILGAAVGFLVWNWSPARIFLGDVGSVPLGYLLGFLLLDAAARGQWKIALILPLYFLADATITLTRRLLRGERIWQAHREHYYQQAVRNGLSHAAVVRRIIAADLLLIGCGLAAENGWGAASLAGSVAIVALLLAMLARGSRGLPQVRTGRYMPL